MVRDMLPEIPLRLLEIFSGMMRSETTTEAAALIGLSQPAVSQGLKQLEEILKLTLFERAHKRLVPTSEAHMLYDEIHSMSAIVRGFALRARDLRQGMVGRLRVTSTPPLGNTLGARALASFMKNRPDLSVSFTVQRRVSNVIEAVQNGSAEVGLAIITNKPVSVNASILKRCNMVVAVNATSELAAQSEISAETLSRTGFIGLEIDSAIGMKVRSAFEQIGSEYRPRIVVGNNLTSITLAACGLGAAIIDPYTARFYAPPHMAIRPFMPKSEIDVSIFTRRGVPRSSLVQAFISELTTQFIKFDETSEILQT